MLVGDTGFAPVHHPLDDTGEPETVFPCHSPFTRLAGDAHAGDLFVVGPSLGTSVETLWGASARQLGAIDLAGEAS